MPSRRRLPTQRRAKKQTEVFDPQAFLTNAGIGRTVHSYKPKQAVFSQGERADAVFYLQEGRVRLSVLSKQGKEATIALLGAGRFPGRRMPGLGSTRPAGNRYRHYGLLHLED